MESRPTPDWDEVARLAKEIAQLTDLKLARGEYYTEFLSRLLAAIAAPAGAIWVRSAQGELQLFCHVNADQIGLERKENACQMHDELLRHSAFQLEMGLIMPQSVVGIGVGSAQEFGNPTDYVLLIAPILRGTHFAALVEVWQEPTRPLAAQRGYLQFILRMAGLASSYEGKCN